MLKISITNWQHVNHPREDDSQFLNHALNFWNFAVRTNDEHVTF
jgi:hypothetical protein